MAATRQPAEHLVFLGHERIGSGPMGVGSGRDRLDGDRLAVEATALMVANNLMTIGALGQLRDAGVAVPAGIALAALDDAPWARLTDPALTVLAHEARKLALPLELRVRESS